MGKTSEMPARNQSIDRIQRDFKLASRLRDCEDRVLSVSIHSKKTSANPALTARAAKSERFKKHFRFQESNSIFGITTVRFKTPINIGDFEWVELLACERSEQEPVEWGFSRKG